MLASPPNLRLALFNAIEHRACIALRIIKRAPRLGYSSTSTSSKANLLEKPTKFNPPSHPQRLRRPTPKHYGPQLTTEESQVQRTKKYPNMMPSEGTFMYWFLTNRSIHVFITLGVLTSLAITTFWTSFKSRSKYYDIMPAASEYISHPFATTHRAWEIYKMHVEQTTAETAEKRKFRIEEAQKRKAYRIAHGLEKLGDQGIELGDLAKYVDIATKKAAEDHGKTKSGEYVDFEGRRRPIKKWFGIW